jgi:hypothetical protein
LSPRTVWYEALNRHCILFREQLNWAKKRHQAY